MSESSLYPWPLLIILTSTIVPSTMMGAIRALELICLVLTSGLRW